MLIDPVCAAIVIAAFYWIGVAFGWYLRSEQAEIDRLNSEIDQSFDRIERKIRERKADPPC